MTTFFFVGFQHFFGKKHKKSREFMNFLFKDTRKQQVRLRPAPHTPTRTAADACASFLYLSFYCPKRCFILICLFLANCPITLMPVYDPYRLFYPLKMCNRNPLEAEGDPREKKTRITVKCSDQLFFNIV